MSQDEEKPEVQTFDPTEQIKLGLELSKILFTKVQQAADSVNLSPPAILIALGVTERAVMQAMVHPTEYEKVKAMAAEVMKDMHIIATPINQKGAPRGNPKTNA